MKQLPGALGHAVDRRARRNWICAMRFFIWRIITSPERFRRELQRVRRDLAFGASLSDALMEMAGRLGVTELTSLVVALTQSLETGTSISDTLSVFYLGPAQAETARSKGGGADRNREIAFPMLLLIIPGIFIVLLGPVLLKIDSQCIQWSVNRIGVLYEGTGKFF